MDCKFLRNDNGKILPQNTCLNIFKSIGRHDIMVPSKP